MDEFHKGKKVVSKFYWIGIPTETSLFPEYQPPKWFTDAIKDGLVGLGVNWCDIKTSEGWEQLFLGDYLLKLDDGSIYPKEPELFRVINSASDYQDRSPLINKSHRYVSEDLMIDNKNEIEKWLESGQKRVNEFYKQKLKEDPDWKPKFTQTSTEVANTQGGLTYSTKLIIE
ncbi:hypothetical protein J2Z32_003759 [Paenibacillus turicensis]|uniref:Uncharacterized protein n=1 Tax=Paenibacillus turicensis TaxID=160487 RepID=A0ABS4FX95_9BACL|nr:hypothetical protein [Paenibacillus turicensis]MBP1907094.1 hypothetical protein [Paenibacillus turicensis]